MSPRPRDPLGELLRLLEVAGEDEHNAGEYIRAHSLILAPALGVAAQEIEVLEALADLDDITLKRRLAPHLKRARQRQRQLRARVALGAAQEAAAALSASVKWRGGDALVDPAVLLDSGITSAPIAFVIFVSPDFTVGIDRETIVKIRRGLPRFPDLVAIVGAGGLRLEWHGGRGRLYFFSREIPEAASRIVVRLPPLARVVPQRKPTVPRPWADLVASFADAL